MADSLIHKIVNRSNLTLLIWSVIGIFIVGGLLLLNLRYLYNFALGPFNMETKSLLQTQSASGPFQYWVNLEGKEMINTGVQYISKSDSGKETIEATYFVMPLGSRLLLVSVQGNQTDEALPANVTGWLSEIGKEENEKVVQDIETSEPALKGMFLPYKLQTGNFRINGFLGIGVGLVILAASLWGLVTFFLRMANPDSHPIMQSLARFGPLDFVVNGIDMELSMPHTTIGKLHLTKSWMVFEAPTKLVATRYEDVTWIYKYFLKQKYNGITVKTTYSAKVYDRFGVCCDFIAGRKEEIANQMLEAICQRTPWAVMGYSDQLEKIWKKDRQGFLAAVEQRKAAQPV